jgi:hypothetical protein
MPLPATVPRTRLHTRTVRFEGYAREDGRFDIEAHLRDVKDQPYELMTGVREPGDPVHEMWVRLTIDRAFNIEAVEATTEASPYPGYCNRIEAAYGKLVGRNLAQGFRKALHDALGGVQGCTHLTEMLGYLPTAAMQALASLEREDNGQSRPFQLDRCHALDTRSDGVRRYYPRWYRGAA